MSYARWGCDGSDVYVYATEYPDRDNKGRIVTRWICQHTNHDEGESFVAKSEPAMLAHLEQHRADGDTVPEYAFERLREEAFKAAKDSTFKKHGELFRKLAEDD